MQDLKSPKSISLKRPDPKIVSSKQYEITSKQITVEKVQSLSLHDFETKLLHKDSNPLTERFSKKSTELDTNRNTEVFMFKR